jgi:thymidylate synthase
MGQADKIYDGIIQDILLNGVWDKDQTVRTKWADGTPAHTKSVITAQMKFDNKEVPILTKKKVAWKTAIKEAPIGFWQKKTNSFEVMHDMNIRIWDEWEIKEGEWAGTIGPSYGYQLGKLVRKVKLSEVQSIIESGYLSKNHLIEGDYVWLDQVDYLLWQLKFYPSSRRHVVSLWNINDLDEMALNPCVWNTQWIVKEGRLHLVVGVRSNDMALGNPFNVFQYYVLQRMIAQVTKLDMGTLTFNINDAHIYERHIETIQEQLSHEEHKPPIFWVNPEIKSFYDFTMDDFNLIDYNHGPNLKFEVAI